MHHLKISSGYKIAYQRWGAGNKIKVLCLHGWLDNSNSFALLGPHLAENEDFEVVAVDHVGHGLSGKNELKSAEFTSISAPTTSSVISPFPHSLCFCNCGFTIVTITISMIVLMLFERSFSRHDIGGCIC